jgi:hypothetical protein
MENKKIVYSKIIWSPFGNNIIDAGQYDLCLPNGEPVDLHRENMDKNFVLIIGEVRLVTEDNNQMSA